MSGAAHDLMTVLAGPALLVGMGNPWRNDDGVGAHVTGRLSKLGLPAPLEVMTVEDVVESYVFDIAGRAATNVVLVDAASMPGAAPGTIVFGRVAELEAVGSDVSTHKLALRVVERVLRRSGKATYLLGIVAADVDFGTAISPAVLAAADRVVDLVCSCARGEA